MKIRDPIKTVFMAIPKGLSITFRYLFRKPVTEQYPNIKPKFEDRYRGLHYLTRYPDGSERCVCCGLCAAACPADCIYMEPAETSEGIRYAIVYEINECRGVYFALCARKPVPRRRFSWVMNLSSPTTIATISSIPRRCFWPIMIRSKNIASPEILSR